MTAFDPSGLGTAALYTATFLFALGSGLLTLALSSVTGIPPFYAVSFIAGALRLPVAAVFLFPELFR
jgi:hypothetical protein